MANDLLESITKKSFEEFRAENSHQVDEPLFNDSSHCFVTCPERDYPHSLKELSVRGGIYIGVSGSVNPTFGHISEILPDLSLLVDINDAAVDYLRFRCTLLEVASNGEEYWDRLGRLLVLREGLTEKMIEASCDEKLPFGLSAKVVKILAHENKRREAKSRNELTENMKAYPQSDTNIKMYMKFRLFNEFSDLNPLSELRGDIQTGGWSSCDRYYRVKKSWEEGRIKGVADDLTSEGFELALDISSKSGFPITVVYISNIDDYWSSKQRESLVNLMKQGLERNLFHPQCKVISWTFVNTKVRHIIDYVGANGY